MASVMWPKYIQAMSFELDLVSITRLFKKYDLQIFDNFGTADDTHKDWRIYFSTLSYNMGN